MVDGTESNGGERKRRRIFNCRVGLLHICIYFPILIEISFREFTYAAGSISIQGEIFKRYNFFRSRKVSFLYLFGARGIINSGY